MYNGINHFKKRKMLAEYAGSKGVCGADLAVRASGAMLLLGGTSVLLGIKPRLGAMATVAFLGTVSPVMHDFWNVEDPNQHMNEMINFSKNMALMGGALALMAVREPWPLSVPFARPGFARRLSTLGRLPKVA